MVAFEVFYLDRPSFIHSGFMLVVCVFNSFSNSYTHRRHQLVAPWRENFTNNRRNCDTVRNFCPNWLSFQWMASKQRDVVFSL